jgi:hypothetical protein
MKNILFAAILMLIVSSLCFGQSATVSATVNTALSVVTTNNLALGTVQKGSTRTVNSTDAGAAAFTITGEHDATVNVTITVPANLTYLSNNLTFNAQIPIYNTTAAQGTATAFSALTGGSTALGTSGDGSSLYIWMGGGVSPGASQASGSYSGTISVAVAYP